MDYTTQRRFLVSKKQAWLYFWLVGLIWGSSFMLIRIGVEAIHPFHVVLIRVSIAAIGLCLVVIARRKHFPRDFRVIRAIAIIGVGNVVMPFTLISVGEQSIDSGLASVLQATAALFSLVVAHFAFADESITRQKVMGLLLGFAGVVVLASRNWQDGQVMTGSLMGQLAVIGASLCYAIFTTYSRKVIQGEVEPVVLSALAMLSASLVEAAIVYGGAALGQTPPFVPYDIEPRAFFAVLLLGFLNTFIAYLMYYDVVKALGVARASMVTYIVPVVGLTLGVLFLDEILDAKIIIGAALIFGGIGIVNLRWHALRLRRAQPIAS